MRIAAALAALGLGLILARPAFAQAPPDNPAIIQQAFEAALAQEARGDLAAGIKLMMALAERTDAPRVRLELARMQFKAGEYRQSRKAFGEVYARDLPYPVRRSINLFLDDIDQRIGYVRPKIGFVLDSNAGQQPSSGTYEVLGTPLTYRNTQQASTGVRYQLDLLAPLLRQDDIQWQMLASVSGAAADAAGYDSQSADLAVRRTRLAQRASAAIGWRGARSGAVETSAPYVQIEQVITPKRDQQASLLASLEFNRFPERSYPNGETARLGAGYARDLGRNLTLQLSTGGSVSTIRDPRWPELTGFVETSAIRSLPRANLNLVVGGGVSTASFSGKDPFFGQERHDTSVNLQVAAYFARPTYGFFPGVVVRQDIRKSKIAFYSYNRTAISVDLRRRF